MPIRPPHLPTVWERLGLEAILRGRPLPGGVGVRTVAGMIEKGWIVEGPPGTRTYSVTETGLEAVKRKLPDSG